MVPSRAFVLLGLVLTACGAGTSGGSSESGGSGQGGSGNSDGGSTSNGFDTGGSDTGSGGGTSNCTDPTCIGQTPQGNCDSGLAIDSGNAMDGARAMGLCKEYVEGGWGVKSAEWVRSDGQPLTGALADGKGILSNFGPVGPREGSTMLVISSGAARDPGDPGFMDPGGYNKDFEPHGSPPGYPKESPSCPNVQTGEPYDSAGLRVVVQTPTDAKSISFDFDFYTYEYPDFICSPYNDFFVAMMTPKPASLVDGNISFDTLGNTISVNAGFLDICRPSNAGGLNFACGQGYGGIVGTGFDSNVFNGYGIEGSAATGWLQTSAPIEAPGGEMTLHFAIWDSGDGVLDSTTLIDNFKFQASASNTNTQPVE